MDGFRRLLSELNRWMRLTQIVLAVTLILLLLYREAEVKAVRPEREAFESLALHFSEKKVCPDGDRLGCLYKSVESLQGHRLPLGMIANGLIAIGSVEIRTQGLPVHRVRRQFQTWFCNYAVEELRIRHGSWSLRPADWVLRYQDVDYLERYLVQEVDRFVAVDSQARRLANESPEIPAYDHAVRRLKGVLKDF